MSYNRNGIICLFIIVLGACTNKDVQENGRPENHSKEKNFYNVGFLIMDGVYNTELTAPYDIFQHTRFREGITPMNTFLVADKLTPVTTFEGIRILPDYDYTLSNHPNIDILVIPSAEHHLDSDLDNEVMINWVRTVGEKASFVTSHCDGAFVLAKSGLLDSVSSTTFPSDIERYRTMFSNLEVRDNVIFVHDGKFITSVGGARSFDGALYLCELLYGKAIAQNLAGGLVIDWNVDQIPRYISKNIKTTIEK